MKILAKKTNRAQWLEARRVGVGGSDVGALAGLSKWSTPLDVYLDKVGPPANDEESTRPQYWGNRLEDLLADEASAVTGVKIRRRNAIIQSRTNPVLIGSLDREIVGGSRGPGVLEIKTTYSFASEEGWGDSGLLIGSSSGASEPIVIDPDRPPQIPDYYYAQVQHYLNATGRQWAYLAALSMLGREFRVYHVRADPDAQEALEEVATSFWKNHVEPKIPPAATDSDGLARLYPQDNGCLVPATADDELVYESLKQVRAELADIETKKTELELALKISIGEACGLIDLDGKPLVTWKTSTTRKVSSPLLQKNHPEIWIESRVESSSRRFLVK